jgi:hypothetical protein
MSDLTEKNEELNEKEAKCRSKTKCGTKKCLIILSAFLVFCVLGCFVGRQVCPKFRACINACHTSQ